jgi:hypothetical protein
MLGYVPSPWIASDRTFVQADDDVELEIVFMRPMGNTIDVHVVNGDGSICSGERCREGTGDSEGSCEKPRGCRLALKPSLRRQTGHS